MSLNYLEFDYSEDTEGVGTYEAMASVSASQVGAVQGEVAHVLAWACHAFPDGRGALDEGFEWDYDLQAQIEYSTQETWEFDAATGTVRTSRQQPGVPRHTVTLSVSGTEAFCQALRDHFHLG